MMEKEKYDVEIIAIKKEDYEKYKKKREKLIDSISSTIKRDEKNDDKNSK